MCDRNHSDMAEVWAKFMNDKYGFDNAYKRHDWLSGYKTAMDKRNSNASPEIAAFYAYCKTTPCRYDKRCSDKNCMFLHDV
jgi:hypothetical protein